MGPLCFLKQTREQLQKKKNKLNKNKNQKKKKKRTDGWVWVWVCFSVAYQGARHEGHLYLDCASLQTWHCLGPITCFSCKTPNQLLWRWQSRENQLPTVADAAEFVAPILACSFDFGTQKEGLVAKPPKQPFVARRDWYWTQPNQDRICRV